MYVVIENFNGMIALVTDEDGNVKEFETRAFAQMEADECQNGLVVNLEPGDEITDDPQDNEERDEFVECKFTSVWCGGARLTTKCEYNPNTGEVIPLECEADIDDVLDYEFITLEDGTEIRVCPDCHCFTLEDGKCRQGCQD